MLKKWGLKQQKEYQTYQINQKDACCPTNCNRVKLCPKILKYVVKCWCYSPTTGRAADYVSKILSHAIASTIALFAAALKDLVGINRAGMAAKTNLVAQLVLAITEDHIHTRSSWLL